VTKAEARRLFVYRNGSLRWRHDRTRSLGGISGAIRIGEKNYKAHYLIWNWHFGLTNSELAFRDGNALNRNIANLYEIAPQMPPKPPPAC
jgi:hypothetical protein